MLLLVEKWSRRKAFPGKTRRLVVDAGEDNNGGGGGGVGLRRHDDDLFE